MTPRSLRHPQQDPPAYGDRHAPVYDQIYGGRFAPEAAVSTLAAAGRDGGVLQLGAGAGWPASCSTSGGTWLEYSTVRPEPA